MARQNALTNKLVLPKDENGNYLPVDPLTLFQTAQEAKESRAKRVRKWEKANPAIRYRIPVELHIRARQLSAILEAISKEYMTTVSSVSTAFVEYSLSHVLAGDLILEGRPKPEHRKMTLQWNESRSGWPQEIKAIRKKKDNVMDKQKPVFLGYRWGGTVNEQIRGIMNQTGILSGEVVVRLLEYAITAYREGRLHLSSKAIVIANKVTPSWGSEK